MIFSRKNPPSGFYVYAYLREDGTPWYVGKGNDIRAWNHSKGDCSRTPTDHSQITIMESNLTEVGAFALERIYIRWYGRKSNDTGILRNLTDGGDGISGWKHSEETKEKCRINNTGKKLSEETKLKMRLAKLGVPKSPEHKANMSKSQKAAGNRPPPNTVGRKKRVNKKVDITISGLNTLTGRKSCDTIDSTC